MPKVSDEHIAARRTEILDAAFRVFARNGYRGSSVAEIIRESGLSTGAVYSYFPSKEKLFQAVVAKTFALKSSQFARPVGQPARSPAAQVKAVISVLEDAIFSLAPQIWAEAVSDPDVRFAVAELFTRLKELLRRELTEWATDHQDHCGMEPEAWAEKTAPVLLSLLPGYILQRMALDDFDEANFLAGLDGLLPG